MKKTLLFALTLSVLAPLAAPLSLSNAALKKAQASEQTYTIVSTPTHKTGIRFSIPYTLGTHDGEALEVSGEVILDLNQPSHARGEFKVPIEGLRTGNDVRDCHMVEALGIDYSKSKFPEDHVCDGNDKVPATGPDSVVYHSIEFKIQSLQVSGSKITGVIGEWVIRDITRPATIPLTFTAEKNGFRLEGTTNLSLAAHDIRVKAAKALGVVVSTVTDTATVNLDLHFQLK